MLLSAMVILIALWIDAMVLLAVLLCREWIRRPRRCGPKELTVEQLLSAWEDRYRNLEIVMQQDDFLWGKYSQVYRGRVMYATRHWYITPVDDVRLVPLDGSIVSISPI